MPATVSLREITDDNRAGVLALAVADDQRRFVSGVAESLDQAAEEPQANPWYRAIYAGEQPVGFVMVSWNARPDPPDIYGPWFLWKLLIDQQHQGAGYGREALRLVVDLVKAEGATELLTSYVEGDGSPRDFYLRLGFRETGQVDPDGEIVLSLPLGH